ncbi:MAG: SGNH/GDSL hydrolase family protein [Planctomycetota bacterium]|nr:SGNH/GDSL hydrolase family protein [Planctomycetota bacterium]
MPEATTNKTHIPRRSRRWLVFVAIGALLLGSAAFLRHYYLSAPPVGKGPAGPAVPREPFQKTWSTRKVLFLGLGDSVTVGFGAPPDHGAFDRLVQNPPNEFPEMQGLCLSAVYPNLEAKNLAQTATNSIQHAEDQIPALQKQPPDVLGIVMITTGGNDLIHSYGRRPPVEGALYGASLDQARPWIEAFEKRLDGMLAAIQERFPGGCEVFLANIYDPTDGAGTGVLIVIPSWPDCVAILRAYNEVIARCAQRRPGVHLVDIHSAFLGHGFQCNRFWTRYYCRSDPYFWYYQNIEDPNDRGYDALRRLFLIQMSKVLAKPDSAK